MINSKRGISRYARSENSWKVSERYTNQAQINKLFEQVQKEIKARESWKSVLTPKYVHGTFVTEDKSKMIEHLKALL